jgi:hypothetical protein
MDQDRFDSAFYASPTRLSLSAAQDVLGNSSFGGKAQDLRNLSGLKEGMAMLG